MNTTIPSLTAVTVFFALGFFAVEASAGSGGVGAPAVRSTGQKSQPR